MKKVPVSVRIIAVLDYIAVAAAAGFGMFYVVVGGLIAFGVRGSKNLGDAMAGVFGGVMIWIGALLIAAAVLGFFVGRGLWKGQKWARIFAVIASIVGILWPVFSTPASKEGYVPLIVGAVIGGYLWFAPEVKQAFGPAALAAPAAPPAR